MAKVRGAASDALAHAPHPIPDVGVVVFAQDRLDQPAREAADAEPSRPGREFPGVRAVPEVPLRLNALARDHADVVHRRLGDAAAARAARPGHDGREVIGRQAGQVFHADDRGRPVAVVRVFRLDLQIAEQSLVLVAGHGVGTCVGVETGLFVANHALFRAVLHPHRPQRRLHGHGLARATRLGPQRDHYLAARHRDQRGRAPAVRGHAGDGLRAQLRGVDDTARHCRPRIRQTWRCSRPWWPARNAVPARAARRWPARPRP